MNYKLVKSIEAIHGIQLMGLAASRTYRTNEATVADAVN